MREAETAERERSALRQDLAAALFPNARLALSEQTVALTRAGLVKIVAGLESALLAEAPSGEAQEPQSESADEAVGGEMREARSWPILARSGLLDHPALLDFLLASACLARTERQQGGAGAGLFAELLDHQDAALADAALAYLAAEARLGDDRVDYRELPPELLHLLAWRIVAALEIDAGARDSALIRAVPAFLAAQHESRSLRGAAKRLAFVTCEGADETLRRRMLDPAEAGAMLALSCLAQRLGLDQELLFAFLADAGQARLAVALRAAGLAPDDAVRILFELRPANEAAGPPPIEETAFREISPDGARALAARWTADTPYRDSLEALTAKGGGE